jgi:uncharacterized protein
MDWFWGALGLMLVLEGLMPFISPGQWRKTMERMVKLQDGQLRFVGLLAVAAGLMLLWLATAA